MGDQTTVGLVVVVVATFAICVAIWCAAVIVGRRRGR